MVQFSGSYNVRLLNDITTLFIADAACQNRTAEYSLGEYSGPVSIDLDESSSDSSVWIDEYDDGTNCVVGGKAFARHADVHVMCGAVEQISRITESTTCIYVIELTTPGTHFVFYVLLSL